MDEKFGECSQEYLQNKPFGNSPEFYDLTQQFLDDFRNSEFSSLESLKIALKNFSLKTGFAYTVKRSRRYRENDIRRHALVYYNVCYGCTLHVQGASHSINVKGAFRVAKFSMIHNHPPPMVASNLGIYPPVFPAFIDCGESFRQAFPTMCAESYVEFANRLKQFEKNTGSVYIKYSTGLFSNTMDPQEVRCRYKKIRYVCVHYGSRRSEPVRRRNQHTTKIGCGSCFSVKYADGFLQIVSYDMRHCHPVDPESARLYPHNRRLTPSETAEIGELLNVNADMNELKKIIKEKYGKICTTRDITNMRSRRRKHLERMSMDQSPSHQPPLAAKSDLTGAELEPLVDVCCRQVHNVDEVKAEDEGICLSPVLQDIQQIAEMPPNGEILTQAWRQGRDERFAKEVDENSRN
ncbi:hypothetical protein Aperf_G00000128066 [Anoplocephala perfoliata]